MRLYVCVVTVTSGEPAGGGPDWRSGDRPAVDDQFSAVV